jgi:hypothetical protein
MNQFDLDQCPYGLKDSRFKGSTPDVLVIMQTPTQGIGTWRRGIADKANPFPGASQRDRYSGPAHLLNLNVSYWQIVLQKDFRSRSEEHFFQIRPQERSLIQKFGLSDSKIARFWRSGGCRRLLQHNRHKADIPMRLANVRSRGRKQTRERKPV